MEIKVFEMNDCEWWAGESLEAVIGEMCHQLACDDKAELQREGYIDEDGTCSEIARETLEKAKYRYEDGSQTTCFAVLQNLISSGHKFPCLIGSTER